MKRVSWEEVANYRAMVDAATDGVLSAWGVLMRSSDGGVRGWPKASAGFDVRSTINDFEDLADEVERAVAASAMAIIYGDRGAGGMPEAHRRPLVTIYCGGAWFGDGEPEVAFLEAVEAFERKARGRGLL
jgi:hypothetical protein